MLAARRGQPTPAVSRPEEHRFLLGLGMPWVLLSISGKSLSQTLLGEWGLKHEHQVTGPLGTPHVRQAA